MAPARMRLVLITPFKGLSHLLSLLPFPRTCPRRTLLRLRPLYPFILPRIDVVLLTSSPTTVTTTTFIGSPTTSLALPILTHNITILLHHHPSRQLLLTTATSQPAVPEPIPGSVTRALIRQRTPQNLIQPLVTPPTAAAAAHDSLVPPLLPPAIFSCNTPTPFTPSISSTTATPLQLLLPVVLLSSPVQSKPPPDHFGAALIRFLLRQCMNCLF